MFGRIRVSPGRDATVAAVTLGPATSCAGQLGRGRVAGGAGGRRRGIAGQSTGTRYDATPLPETEHEPVPDADAVPVPVPL